MKSGCPRSLQVATFMRIALLRPFLVRLPPQSPSRYIRIAFGIQLAHGPVAPAVSKSLHSGQSGAISGSRSGCPRSLQVATFIGNTDPIPISVRLPPQSPSRYIRRAAALGAHVRPVAPAVSKSLHSRSSRPRPRCRSGCPRSLQVATFPGCRCTACRTSGCPRSLQVATFEPPALGRHRVVRLPPQSPSRYIPRLRGGRRAAGPVAPAVSKSLHSPGPRASPSSWSGCPRSLQVATFSDGTTTLEATVRLPPQSPSRYIPSKGRRERG